jgi:hypothetical protein
MHQPQLVLIIRQQHPKAVGHPPAIPLIRHQIVMVRRVQFGFQQKGLIIQQRRINVRTERLTLGPWSQQDRQQQPPTNGRDPFHKFASFMSAFLFINNEPKSESSLIRQKTSCLNPIPALPDS